MSRRLHEERRYLGRDRIGGLVEGRERVPDAHDPAVRHVIELDHAELDDLVRAMIETGRFGVEQDADLVSCPGCACRKSNPNILVMQPAQDRAAKNGPGQFDGARDRRILLQR